MKQNKKYLNNKCNNNNNIKTKKYNNNNSFFKDRYNLFLGKNSFNKLIEAKNIYSNNQFIRINLSKTNITEIERFLKDNRVKFSKTFIPNALKIEKSFFNISSSLENLSGNIYIQDLASQIPVNTVNFEILKKLNRKIKILDMAASPGSKTTQIADLCEYYKLDYNIIAIEPDENRLNKLINNIQRQEFKNIEIINEFGEKFQSKNKFDLILLDAPCSGNLIDDKNWLNKRDLKGINENAELQKKMLKNAYNLLEKNGQLIYSTCSLEPEENELNVDWFLKKFKVKSEKINLKFGFETKPILKFNNIKFSNQNSIRITPYLSKTQGFFVSKFYKI